jgi:hypothetical protein
MTLNANTVLILASVFLILFSIVALILAAPGAKRQKHSSLK